MLSFVLRSDGARFAIDEYYRGRRLRSLRVPLPATIGAHGPLRDDDYRRALATACWALDIDLIHVHHLRHHTLDVADVAAARGIPYVVTLHDYFMLCPSYTLLAPGGHPCGACTGHPGAKPDACMAALGEPPTYLAAYQVRMRTFLSDAARVLTPSAAARDIVTRRYPELRERIDVIEHGYVSPPRSAPAPRLGARDLRVAVIGGLDVHKGGAVFRALLRANRRDEITFHFYGTTPDGELQTAPRDIPVRLDGSRFVNHGPYGPGEIVDRLVADGIDVGLLLSIWPETFSYTLSELADAGVPAIAGDLGAPAERIRRHRLGWTVADIRDPAPTLAILDRILDDPRVRADVAAGMDRAQALAPLATAWRRYADIYERTIATRRTVMTDEPDRRYVAWLAMQLAEETEPLRERVRALEAEVASLRERLRSPRHRVADTAAGGLQKIPVVWPIVARVTDAVLRREARGGHRDGAR
jgi:glycosyltransferase involved in cell wall biosynthesis